MDLAPMTRASSLEGPTELGDVAERVYSASQHCRDHPDVTLATSTMRLDGTWMFQGQTTKLSRHALSQLCARIELPTGGTVPAGYISRCPSPLAADNLNHWLRDEKRNGQQVLVRTREEKGKRHPLVRAVLSDKYATVDHQPLVSVLRALCLKHELYLDRWSLDDEQLTLRLLLNRDVPATLDDPIRVGLHVSNSEVGLGRISITALVTRLVCTNGLVVKVADLGGIHRRHIGRAGEDLQGVAQAALPRVLEEAEEAGRRFVKLRDLPAPAPFDEFLERTAKEAELPETILPLVRQRLDGETLYDVVNAFTNVA
jgi:hypothetical protein